MTKRLKKVAYIFLKFNLTFYLLVLSADNFANSLNPYQAQLKIVLYLDTTLLHSDGIPKRN